MSESELDPPARVLGILVTFKRLEILKSTLDAVLRQTRPPDSILVVDNAADDAVRDHVTPLEGVHYLAMPENAGPAGAVAAGMASLLERASPEDWLLLIDDDDPPRSESVVAEILEAALRAPLDVAAVGRSGSRYDPRSGALERLPDHELQDETEEFSEVDVIGSGHLPLYRVRAVEEIGLFDPDLFFGFEELDFGLRLRRAGWRMVTLRRIKLRGRELTGRLGYGARPPSRRKVSRWRSYYSARNQVLIARRYGRWTAPLVATLRIALGGAIHALAPRSTGHIGTRLRGLRHGWRGVVGRTVDPESF